ncbi:substrate-binding domain-containing protein [Mangrovicoccus sp. HB161399]|uniref:substrate-binding domain-containing protein n=1 Tax=Mangrovicoccus sp. HB161399 TaxID=2720392 RepID=UPI0020A63D58|nr:substrate-binding domain-containing protein [Mangrovicoccus sp. HB161399]
MARKPSLAAALALALAAGTAQGQVSDLVSTTHFRVCADPANLPMSNDRGEGYENRLAEFFAEKLGLPVQYTWFPMATGFIRNTLRANKCDVVIGYAQGHELVQNTNHYMTSVFTLVVPADGPLADVETLSDPRLEGLKIGVIAGSPPATHMARNGLIGKAKAYNLTVDRRVESPAVDMLDDLDAGETDAAVLWGPLAGPLVKQGHPELKVIPLLHETLPPRLFFRITMGVRPGDKTFEHKLNSLIRRNQGEINAILSEAGVPLVDDMGDAMLETTQ